MSLNTTLNTIDSNDDIELYEFTSQAFFEILKKWQDKKFISNLEQKEDEIVSFTIEDKDGFEASSEAESLLETFDHQSLWLSYRVQKVEQNPLYQEGPVRCVRLAKPEEREIIASDKEVRVLTFDSLMEGVAGFDECKEEVNKWRSLEGDALSKAITNYVEQNVKILGIFNIAQHMGCYTLASKCENHYRELLNKLLLQLAQHPIGRKTVVAALCINRTVLKDLPMVLGIEPNMTQNFGSDFTTFYGPWHCLRFSPYALESIGSLHHALGNLIFQVAGFRNCLAFQTQEQFILDLLCRDDSFATCVTKYQKFIHDSCAYSTDWQDEDGLALPTQFIAKAYYYLSLKEHDEEKTEAYYEFKGILQHLLPKLHFGEVNDMLKVIGLGEIDYTDTQRHNYILINHFSDFDFLEKVPWGHDQGDYLDKLLEYVQDNKAIWDNAEKTVIGLRKLGFNQTGPNEAYFKKLCQLHGRSESTSYIDVRRMLSLEEYQQVFDGSNIRKM